MFQRLKLYFLTKLYQVLVLKVCTIDRSVMPQYHKFNTFCDLNFDTNQGRFSFSFKEDRRSMPRDILSVFKVGRSYLVELKCPADIPNIDNPLYQKVIVVTMIHLRSVNYEALAHLLLSLYIDQFPTKLQP